MMQPASHGSPTWVASSYILMRYAPAISSTRTNCASISIPALASSGKTCATSPWK